MTHTTDTASLLRAAILSVVSLLNGASAPDYRINEAKRRLNDALAAPVAAIQPAEKRRRATDAEIAEWVERHCLERGLSGSGSDNRAAFEDAESLHMTFEKSAASAPAQPDSGEHPDAKGWLPSDAYFLPMWSLIEDYMGACDYHGGQNGEKCDAALAAIRAYLMTLAEPAQPEAKGEAHTHVWESYWSSATDGIDHNCECGAIKSIVENLAAPVPAAPADDSDPVGEMQAEARQEKLDDFVRAAAADKGELPPLPDDPDGVCEVVTGHFTIPGTDGLKGDEIECQDGYSADQMLAYGQACILADRARQAAIAQPSTEALEAARLEGREGAFADECSIMKTNKHYRERKFNRILELDAAEGLPVRFTRAAAPQPPASTVEQFQSDCAKVTADLKRPPASTVTPGSIGDDADRQKFEALASDSYGFKRSRRGTYVNGSTARDWKWFRLGTESRTAALIDAASKERGGDTASAKDVLRFDDWCLSKGLDAKKCDETNFWIRCAYEEGGASLTTSAKDAWRDVLAERQRQINVEGWTPKHDDDHDGSEMAKAAACYAYPELTTVAGLCAWPWHQGWWKPKDERCNLVRAGALILAEIERLDRAAIATTKAAK